MSKKNFFSKKILASGANIYFLSRLFYYLVIIGIIFLISPSGYSVPPSTTGVVTFNLVDPNATEETKYLFANLIKLAPTNLLFGHQDDLEYGIGWWNEDGRSDVYQVCGSYPAVYGWDFSKIGATHNAHNIPFTRVAELIRQGFDRGGLHTFSWHMDNPVTGENFYDVTKAVYAILPGGNRHEFYKTRLDAIAEFAKNLTGSNGRTIPVIFRPFHEHTGSWFWWGKDHCTTVEYVSLWRFTVEYLRDEKEVHNFLYAYSPGVCSRQEYLERYPGDDYVDIFGLDDYSNVRTTGGRESFLSGLRMIVELAQAKQKLAALTEVGIESLPVDDWWTNIILNPIKTDSVARKISYFLVWRNASLTHFFAPFPGHTSVPDFMNFFDDLFTMLEIDLPNMYALTTNDSLPPIITELPEKDFTAVNTPVTVMVRTNERASLRYSTIDQSYEAMPSEFEMGQGAIRHFTTITGQHGQHYQFYVRAIDNYGNVMDTSAVISFAIDTSLAPVYWYDLLYNDSDWQRASTPIGTVYDDVTQIARVNAAYFRHKFTIADDPMPIHYLSVKLKYDDGVVIYLNGKEVGRINMDFGEVNYDTRASSSAMRYKGFNIDPDDLALLKKGENLLALEVHQFDDGENDMYFDCRLLSKATVTDTIIDYGAEWHYYDLGQAPPVQTLGDIARPVENLIRNLPYQFYLRQNYPNPFNAATTIEYYLGSPGCINFDIYNILGHHVKTLVNQKQSVGRYRIRWDGKNNAGEQVATGIYLIRFIVDNQLYFTRKMVMLQ